MRCLVIDDDLEDRFLVERMLRRYGYRPTCVSSGAAAIAALGESRFDIALVDLQMEGMSGAETLRALREMDGKMRLLVVSGCDDREHVLEALEAGADGYLLKDELGERLQFALQDIIAGKCPLSSTIAGAVVRQATGRAGADGTRATLRRPRKLADTSGELILGGVTLPKTDG